MLRTGAQNGLNREKKITLFLMKKNYKFSHSVFNSAKITLAFSSWLTWSCLRLLLNLENLIILKHGLAVTFSSLLPSAGYLLYIIFFQICFWKLECQPTFQCKFFFPSVFQTWLPFNLSSKLSLRSHYTFKAFIYLFLFDTYLLKLYYITVAGPSSQGYVVFPSYKIVS